MIVVTGATGRLGREIVRSLLPRVPANRIVASVRNLEKVPEWRETGLQVRKADFDAPDSLLRAFADAEQVMILSVDTLGDTALRLHRNAIDAARAVGAGRILYTSHMGARPDALFAPAFDHAATEALLVESGASFTSLRHGFYAESALHMIGPAFDNGELRVPEDGPVSWTARNDLAEADAIVLSEPGRLGGITPALTALDAFTMADLATIASELTGHEIRHVTLSDEQWLREKVEQGVPERMATMLLGMYRAARRGDFAKVDPTLASLLGRRPQSMRDVLAGRLSRRAWPIRLGHW